ncbi:MAG TPA: metallophosphoesterase [Dehalococcoidia bacterium]|jgi:DNA repair exonuclease SbcCD nuclease subunit
MSDNAAPREITIVHTSDLHLGTHGERDDLEALRLVLATGRHAGAHAALLAGDVFDTNRLPLSLIDRVARMLADAPMQIVILPGNHDPATADSAYRKGGLGDPPNVHVLGVTCDETVLFDSIELEICGKPHMDYVDMAPLFTPARRAARHQIVMAHGHFVRSDYDLQRSWLMHDTDIDATRADYVALGHWELAQQVGTGTVDAYYSGSPGRAGTVNVVHLDGGRPVVTHMSVRADDVERRERESA